MTRGQRGAAEAIFGALLTIAVLLQLNAFIWIYYSANAAAYASGPLDISPLARAYSNARNAIEAALLLYVLLAKSAWRLLSLAGPMIALCGYFLLSVTWSDFPYDSLHSFTIFALQVIVGLAVCSGVPESVALARLKWIAAALIVANVAFSAAFPDLAAESAQHVGVYEGALRGIFSHKNALGACAALSVTPIIAATIRDGRLRLTLGAAALLALSAALVALSRSATSVITFGLAFVAYGVQFGAMRAQPPIGRVATLTILAVVAALIVVSYQTVVEMFPAVLGRDATLTGRTFLWDFALKMADLRPTLGYGFDGFWQAYNGSGGGMMKTGLWQDSEAHNAFLEAYLSGGVVGLSLTVGLLLYLAVKSLAALVRDPSSATVFFAVCATLQILVRCLTESDFPIQAALSGTYLTVAIVILRTRPEAQAPRPR